MNKPNHDVRNPMTSSQWAEIEDWYLDKAKAIEIRDDMDPRTMMETNADVAFLFTQARFDYAYIKRQYEKFKRQLKRAEKQAYMAVKDIGKNDKEREALVNKYLEDNKVFQHPVIIYDAIDIYEERAFFMEAVIDDIREKSARLITMNGALKLDMEMSKQQV